MTDIATNKLMLALLAFDTYNRGSYSELKWGGDADGVPPVTTLSALLETVPRPRGVA
jgi:hypothetical protein